MIGEIVMTRGTLRAIGKAARNDRGNVATLTAFALVPLIILTAGVLNFGFAWAVRNELQSTADAAALAGASQLGDDAQVLAEANEFAANNMAATPHGDVLTDPDVEIGHWDNATRVFTPGGTPENAVRATTRRSSVNGNSLPAFLGDFIGRDEWNLTTQAIAAVQTTGEGCILALDPAASGAFSMGGNASLTLNGCSAMSNSEHSTSFLINGSATATMDCAFAAGGISATDLTLTQCPSAEPDISPAPDPFENVPEPAMPSPCKNLPNGQGHVNIAEGCYFGGDLKGSKTFTGGVYVINGGTLKISAQANITGNGVTFFLTNNATVDFNANGKMTLSAPTSGTYAGILFYGDPDNVYNTNKFNGTPTSSLTGALYFPSQEVQYLGNFSGVNGCMRIVARTIDFRGNTTMSVTCPQLAAFPLRKKLALVN
jgi:Flp pilus assembly protein TadG